LIQGQGYQPAGVIYGEQRILTTNCGNGRRTTLDEYVAAGGYQGLRNALGMSPEAVIAEVKASGLVGRGGAAFPTGLKWEGAAQAPGKTKYVVCNADESEPGTFKDRVLLEQDPQRTLEGRGALMRSAHRDISTCGEYPQAYKSSKRQ
jgi:NADH-quinone oxidoreductase subunit F